MRWLGRGRALYKLSIGGHSALVSKDHVCESRSPVRKAFARVGATYPAVPFRGPRGGVGRPRPTGCGEPSQEDRSWGDGGSTAEGEHRPAAGAWRARVVRPRPETVPRALALSGGRGRDPAREGGGGGRRRAWPGAGGPVASAGGRSGARWIPPDSGGTTGQGGGGA